MDFEYEEDICRNYKNGMKLNNYPISIRHNLLTRERQVISALFCASALIKEC